MPGGLRRPALAEGVHAALDRRLRRDTRAPLAIGLSGGGDSLALLHLAVAWTRDVGRPLLALTVDHGLSAESAGWTARAGAMACAAGADWRALTWTGPKPTTGLPAAARDARHSLLANAARAAGASVILLAHTADDVAEGEWMRETGAAPTLGALRDWAPSPAWPEGRSVLLLRPLLDTSRAELRVWLRERGLVWIDDPANADPRFARARARAALTNLTGLKWMERAAFPRQPGDVLKTTAGAADGSLRLPVEALVAALHPAKLLAGLLLCAGGGDRPPAAEALARALERLGDGGPPFTLAGTRAHREKDCICFTRELGRRLPAPLPVAPGETAVWDGRFEVTAHEPGWAVQPLCGLAARLPPRERLVLRETPAAARRALPALVSADGDVRLAPPFGEGPALIRPLAHARLLAACGAVTREP